MAGERQVMFAAMYHLVMARHATAALLAVCVLACAQTPRDSISLLTTGAFHGDEVKAHTGERWLALLPGSSGFAWQTVSITTRRVEDAVVDGPGEKTGIEVTVKAGDPVLLLKGASELLGRKVRASLYKPQGLVLPDKDALELSIAGHASYRLLVVDRRMGDDAPEKPSRLVLESGGVEQVLYEWPSGLLDQHCKLVWAGDLDGDGKLDLFMILSDHYNVTGSTLFLSSRSSSGKLVELVAAFITMGC
jgi:hypothetical protein